MKRIESLEAFFEHRGIGRERGLGRSHGRGRGHGALFNVFENGGFCTEPLLYNRRDFYKIALLLGKSRLSWHSEEIEITRPALVFYNPQIPYSWMPVSEEQPGYSCLFKKEFLDLQGRNESLNRSPLFRPDASPAFFLDKKQVKQAEGIFRQMLEEVASDYIFKDDLLRSQLQLLIHQALKMENTFVVKPSVNAAQRITKNFLELLERQFPIDSPQRTLQLRAPGDFAKQLAVHVNHLNHAVKEVTGKPTSQHIADRILAEAKALLKHSNWPVTDIAYGLGFEYPNYFYNFFKKKTGQSPKLTRAVMQ